LRTGYHRYVKINLVLFDKLSSMKHRTSEGYLDETAATLLTEAGIISSLSAGLKDAFSHLPIEPCSIQITDITKQNHIVKIRYTYSLNGTEIPACLPVTAGVWLSGEGPLTSKQMKILKSLARPIDS
jgi:hypothetical protein